MNRRISTSLMPLTCAVCAASVSAQGADYCYVAVDISGTGAFAVSTLGATTGTEQSGSCTTAFNDVWFRWTPTTSGVATFQTCGGASVDTVIAAYAASTCPGPGALVACNDDWCAFQSQVTFPVTAGSSYMLQLGAFGSSTTYSGSFNLSIFVPSGSDSCSAPQVLTGSGPFAFDNQLATTSPEGQTNPLCGSPAGIDRDLWYTWTSTATASMEVSLCGGATFDTKVAVYAGAGCPAAAAIACNDDSCALQSQAFFNAVAGNTYSIQLGSWPSAAGGSGTFTIAPGSGGCPSPSVGPDVIVGSITETLNAPAEFGLDAFAVGMGACNVGDTTLNWYAPTNLHPVIGYSLYRYSVFNGASRFEQVGLSWLKHGFGAATENLCCVCQNPGNSQILGIGCADTYSSGLNGNQASLGPRWQVNAHTGVFTYPPANPSWSGTTARRCEVLLGDLELTGGTTRFFCEGTYVTQDDAAAGNQDNNASAREFAVTGSPADYTFALTGGVYREQTAIEVWPTIESGVTLSDLHVPGDGRILVASKATSLGGGMYHYEFAVHNMNSDRNCGSFSVPVPFGAQLTNIGFHDVTYRNGDGPGNVDFSTVDWTPGGGGALFTWSTASFASDPSANCIRWGTTYNFRFDANVAPANGNVSLGLWKPGTPTAVAAAAQVPALGTLVTALCAGDGVSNTCPCGNESAPGSNLGCLNSLGLGGALAASGFPSVTTDTFALQGSNMPDSSALYFQGSFALSGGAGLWFGDGLRCAGGSVFRLGTKTNAGGSSTYPAPGDVSVSVRGSVSVGDVLVYQCWYRNAAAFCQPETFNLTNALQVIWQP